MADDGPVVYDLTRLDEHRFEDVCRALAMHVLGPGLQVFGPGPDGGREAAFEGSVPYSTAAGDWNGYGVLQAKCRLHDVGNGDAQWLIRTIKQELDQWTDPARRRVVEGCVPEYLIIATNVRLTSVPQRGGIDRVRTLLAGYADRLGLKGWDLWDANKLTALLNAYPQVAVRFAEFITPGQVLVRAIDSINGVNAALADVAVARFTVGQGQPGLWRAFEHAYRAAGGGVVLGDACSEVYDDGPGWVQHFTGVPAATTGGGEMVIACRSGRPAVAVSAELWDIIRGAGRTGQLAAVGYPVVAADTPPLLSTAVGEVFLDGGDWPAGRLVRDPHLGWRWKPQLAFSFDAGTRDWHTAGVERMDLRLRCAATMHWADVATLTIDGAGRQRVRAGLSEGALGDVAAALATRFGLDTAPGWERTPEVEGPNDRRFASYRRVFPGTGGRPALGVWAWFGLPDGLRDTVVSIVDVRIDFTALPGHVAGPDLPLVVPGQRLDTTVLRRCLAVLWMAASQVLPLAASADPLAIAPAGTSRVEVHLATERPWAGPGERVVGLLDMLDLAEWGTPPEQPRPWMSAAVTTPLDLTEAEVSDLVERALCYLESGYGFLEADDA